VAPPSPALTWLRAGLLAAAWIAIVDAALAAAAGAPLGALVWTTPLALSIGLGAIAPVAIIALPLLSTRAGGAALAAITRRRTLRAGLGALGGAAATALVVADARLYVRLYLSLHLALGAAALVAAQLGAAAAFPAPALTTPRARARAFLGGGLLAWLVVFAGSLTHVLDSPALRVVALERTTLASHGLLAMQEAWGILDSGPGADEAARAEVAALLAPAPVAAPSGLARGANVLLVTVDSLRTDHVPTGGAIARVAREGVVFDHAYAPSCWTIHSMSAVLTSRLPSQLRYTYVSVGTDLRLTPHAATDALVTDPRNAKKVTPVPWDDPTPTLAGLLGRAGWQTATMIGYVFYRPEAGVTREFQVVDDRAWREHNLDNQGTTGEALSDAALAYLGTRDRARPFFLWIHYEDPHAPYVAQDDAARGGDDLARYDSEIRYTDRQLGRVLDALAADGSLADTVIIVHADHGEEFRDHGGQFHATTLYEEIVHVPLIVRLPARAGVAPGRRDAPVSLLDLAPTLVDLLGVSTDAGFIGQSLVPLLRGEAAPARTLLAECRRFGRDKRMVLAWPRKLVLDRAVGTVELYDLATDPRERTNLVERDADAAAHLAAMAAALP
jgi:arylsulfatase A-like enzyme